MMTIRIYLLPLQAIKNSAMAFQERFARSMCAIALFHVRYRAVPGSLWLCSMSPSGVPDGSRRGGRRYYLLPTNFAFGTWVARLIAAPLNQRARRVHQEGRNDLQLAAVEPTSDSALPIRAKLSEDPNIVGRKGGMTCSSAA